MCLLYELYVAGCEYASAEEYAEGTVSSIFNTLNLPLLQSFVPVLNSGTWCKNEPIYLLRFPFIWDHDLLMLTIASNEHLAFWNSYHIWVFEQDVTDLIVYKWFIASGLLRPEDVTHLIVHKWFIVGDLLGPEGPAGRQAYEEIYEQFDRYIKNKNREV